MPERPQQKAAFLPFPKSRDLIIKWQIPGRMAPYIMIFEVIIMNDVIKN
jgi:hypothetical protein